MTVYVLVDEDRRDGLQNYLDDIRFAEDMPLNIIDMKQWSSKSAILDAVSFSMGDCLHVRSIVDLGQDLTTAMDAILRITGLGVRIVVAELDGFEFRKGNSRQYTDLLRLFTVDGQSRALPTALSRAAGKSGLH